MKQLKTRRRIGLITICIYVAWLVLTVAMWGVSRMLPNRAVFGISLVFSAFIFVLLCFVAHLPQLRTTQPQLTQTQSDRIIRARLMWLALLRLIFVGGFCGMSVSLLFSSKLRVFLAFLFMLTLLMVTLRFILQCRAISASKQDVSV